MKWVVSIDLKGSQWVVSFEIRVPRTRTVVVTDSRSHRQTIYKFLLKTLDWLRTIQRNTLLERYSKQLVESKRWGITNKLLRRLFQIQIPRKVFGGFLMTSRNNDITTSESKMKTVKSALQWIQKAQKLQNCKKHIWSCLLYLYRKMHKWFGFVNCHEQAFLHSLKSVRILTLELSRYLLSVFWVLYFCWLQKLL